MRLVLQLVARLLVVVALCLGAATVWATIDAYRSVDRATAASAERVSQALEALYWRELLLRSNRTREHLATGVGLAHHRDDEADFAGNLRPGRTGRRVRDAAVRPEQGHRQQRRHWWFAATVETLFGTHAAVARAISVAQRQRRHRLGHRRSRRRDIAGLASHRGEHPRRAADGAGHRLLRLARDRAHAGAGAADRRRAETDGARPVPDTAAALPVDGTGHDRASRRRSRRTPRAGDGRTRGADPAPARNPQRRAAGACPRTAR